MANTGSLLRRAGAAEKGPDGRYAAWGARNVSAWRTARRFFQICSGIMAELWASEEVLPFKFASMVSIAAAPGLDQTRLAEELGIDRTNTGQVLDRLEAKGLVERRSDPADRRIRRLFLTARGVAILKQTPETDLRLPRAPPNSITGVLVGQHTRSAIKLNLKPL